MKEDCEDKYKCYINKINQDIVLARPMTYLGFAWEHDLSVPVDLKNGYEIVIVDKINNYLWLVDHEFEKQFEEI